MTSHVNILRARFFSMLVKCIKQGWRLYMDGMCNLVHDDDGPRYDMRNRVYLTGGVHVHATERASLLTFPFVQR